MKKKSKWYFEAKWENCWLVPRRIYCDCECGSVYYGWLWFSLWNVRH